MQTKTKLKFFYSMEIGILIAFIIFMLFVLSSTGMSEKNKNIEVTKANTVEVSTTVINWKK